MGLSPEQVKAFCRALSGTLRRRVRIPTASEWQYACKAGLDTPYRTGMTLLDCEAAVRVFAVHVARTRLLPPGAATLDAVGSYAPNAWGLHDMHGSVLEVVATLTDQKRIMYCGGSRGEHVDNCHSDRWVAPKGRLGYCGFRIVMECP
jgi:formylglycine-generating enzyme required for sulfatase activity